MPKNRKLKWKIYQIPKDKVSMSTAQKMKFSIKDFSSKCEQIRKKLHIHLRNPLWKTSVFVQ